MNKKDIGNFGEDKTCEFLENKGYKILDRNFHTRYGEIDIIAQKEDTVVFCEVKTRKNSYFANACEYVDIGKQKKIIKSAYLYLGSISDVFVRFDVSEVYYGSKNEALYLKSINYIENAFICDEHNNIG